MKFRGKEVGEIEAMESREEVRELAEALSLYRSAMTHLAERSSAHPRPAVQRSASPFRLRLLVGPVVGAALAAGILLPVYGHLHSHHAAVLQAENTTTPDPASARASVDDTVLMNQIDSQLSETVPDALEPLADLSAQTAATQSSVSEKKQ
jgi:hypothetical protein